MKPIEIETQSIELHFPTPVLTRKFSDADSMNRELTSVIDALEHAADKAQAPAQTVSENTTQGGFQTHLGINILEDSHPSMKRLKQEIVMPSIEHYLEQVLKVDPLFTPIEVTSWAVSLGSGDWQAPHIHPNEYTLISGIYYICMPERPEPEGCLEFINPMMSSVSLGQQNASRRHRPKAAELLLFPPYYMHYVHPMRGGTKRQVIAFDVRLKTS